MTQVSAVSVWVFRELTSFDEIGAELEKKIVQLASGAMGSWKLLSSIVLIEAVTRMDPPLHALRGFTRMGSRGKIAKEAEKETFFFIFPFRV